MRRLGTLAACCILMLPSCAVAPKGQIIGNFYIPPRGDLKCEILGGAEYGRIAESYSEFGGLIYFKDDMFAYRVDFQAIHGAPSPVPLDTAKLDGVQKSYLHKEALPLTLKDRPGGSLVQEGPDEDGRRRVYVGLLHYAKPVPDATLAATGPHYKAVVVHITDSYAYTVTSESVDKTSIGQLRDENMRQAIDEALGHSGRCTFGGQL